METNPMNRGYRYETESFILRQVEDADAQALLKCYSDPAAVALMNDDNCVNGFLFETLEQMRNAIKFWNGDDYARPAVIHKASGEAVGTLEIFGAQGNKSGVLRVDLRTGYEREDVLRELYGLAAERFMKDFPMASMVTKAVPQARARRKVLEELGFFGPERFREYEGYYRLPAQRFRRDLGMAFCGLACCLCGESDGCEGCRNGAKPCYDACENWPCAREKGLSGCWECGDFPCEKPLMGNSPRAKAFAKFARLYGAEHLLDCLEHNWREGIVYHYPGGLTGDYDLPTEQEIFELLEKSGK